MRNDQIEIKTLFREENPELIALEASVLNGRYHGNVKVYHDNGVLAKDENYLNGKENGLFKWYNNKGKLTGITYHCEDGSINGPSSMELKTIQYFDDLKGELGIKKRSLIELNRDQINHFSKKYKFD